MKYGWQLRNAERMHALSCESSRRLPPACLWLHVCVCSSHDDMVAMSLPRDWEKVEATVLFFLRLMVFVLFSSSCFMSPASRPAINCSRHNTGVRADSRDTPVDCTLYQMSRS